MKKLLKIALVLALLSVMSCKKDKWYNVSAKGHCTYLYDPNDNTLPGSEAFKINKFKVVTARTKQEAEDIMSEYCEFDAYDCDIDYKAKRKL